MVKLSITLCLVWAFTSCQTDDLYSTQKYFSESERDTLLTNIITYMGPYAYGATNETRFEARFRKHYVAQLKKYKFESYFIDKDSIHYFLVIRPVGGGGVFKRAIGGKLRLKPNSLEPAEYEEMWCSPHLKKDSVALEERAKYVFKEMVKIRFIIFSSFGLWAAAVFLKEPLVES